MLVVTDLTSFHLDTLLLCFLGKPSVRPIIEGHDSVAVPRQIGGAGFRICMDFLKNNLYHYCFIQYYVPATIM